jgi:hypothetical protein
MASSQLKVNLSVTAANSPRQMQNGRTEGHTLAELRKWFGGDEFDLVDPFGRQPHHVSLKQWASADPQKTYIIISFQRG